MKRSVPALTGSVELLHTLAQPFRPETFDQIHLGGLGLALACIGLWHDVDHAGFGFALA
jgi:hypothetical protein